MSETSQQIVSLIVSKEFNKAKNLITESMNEKLGLLLEEKLMEYAPTLFEAKKLDPVDQEDGDINDDGVKNKTDDYLINRRNAIAANIKKKK